MDPVLDEMIKKHRKWIYLFLQRLVETGRSFLLRTEITAIFQDSAADGTQDALKGTFLERLILDTQEAALWGNWVYFAVRGKPARNRYFRFHVEDVLADEVSAADFLGFKERIVEPGLEDEAWTLELDLGPFNRDFPRMKEPRSIGRGVEFLNRVLSSRLFRGTDEGLSALVEFLRVHQYEGQQLMLSPAIGDVESLRPAIERAMRILDRHDDDTAWSKLAMPLQEVGFLPGWGGTVARVRETLSLLLEILEAPAPDLLELFLARIPMIFNIAIISPHGFFGQSGVLGLPDTGGQVVYILNQVRALEKEMQRQITEQGLDIKPQILIVTRLIPESRGTSCDQRLEAVAGTANARILRVGFRTAGGELVPDWISRFEIYPYLERFALDAERELLQEMDGRPDLILGNYTDGNLVASLMSRRLGVTQCNIAHALEKLKYLYSDLYWKDNDERYHFGCQFTADLIAMNTADFIIASTYQEIAGDDLGVGQYESYQTFTMPGLYRVVNGIDIFDPKFNIVSPGADSEVYFPYTDKERRLFEVHDRLGKFIFGEPDDESRGRLENPALPPIFSMARLDHIKNLTGLVEWYGRDERLRKLANLVIIGGVTREDRSSDAEERQQVRKMHELFDTLRLDGSVRWLGIHMDKNQSGEMYRFLADRRGIFVQPALFEAFGLTVVEAMASGLPTFATRFGGPWEIIEDKKSGFHIDPTMGSVVATTIADFFEKCANDPSVWDRISRGGIERVNARYTWERYARRLLTLSGVYGFWKHITRIERQETARYLDMFYSLMFRPLAEKVPS